MCTDKEILRNIGESLCKKFLSYLPDSVKCVSNKTLIEDLMPEALAIAIVEFDLAEVDIEALNNSNPDIITELGKRSQTLAERFADMITLHRSVIKCNKAIQGTDTDKRAKLSHRNIEHVRAMLEQVEWLHDLLKIDDRLSELTKAMLEITKKAAEKEVLQAAVRS